MLSQRRHRERLSVAMCAASRGDVAIQFPSVGRTVRRLLLRVTTICLGSRTQVVPIDLCFFEAHRCPSLGACGDLHGQRPLIRSAMMRACHDNVQVHWEGPLFFDSTRLTRARVCFEATRQHVAGGGHTNQRRDKLFATLSAVVLWCQDT